MALIIVLQGNYGKNIKNLIKLKSENIELQNKKKQFFLIKKLLK